jgi:formate hydrogenlyase transcriptional activator
LKNSSVMAFHQDQDLRYTWMEHPILAWAEQEYVGKTDAEIIGADGSTLLETLKRGVLDTGNALCQEVCIAINGADRYFDLTVELMRNSDGTSSGINGAFVDVTERKKDNRRLRELSAKLCEDTLDLESEVRIQPALQGILGDSAALQGVLAQATIVAQSDSTVLLLGETGTGKELVARAIHRMSRRCENSFIKLNCAAIPTGLLESELFGYERGAFTHAVTQKVGRLELADKGTFFLDEVGEIPLEQQPKLLRVLQDREFERLGSVRTTKVDIRLIAATNRNLAQSVESREFRRDLFYRLNVFPIVLPPLRERREDIPILVHHLVRRYAAHMNKKIETIPSVALRAMIQAEWPGNIRQLENFVERAVILTQGTTLRISLSDLHAEASNSPETIDRIQRSYLLRVLRECGGIIAGPNGAAAKLGLKRTTLSSKMLRLGISRRDYQLDPPEPGLRNPSNPAA